MKASRFIAVFALLLWSGTETAISLRHACIYRKGRGRRRRERQTEAETEAERQRGIFFTNKMRFWTRRILKIQYVIIPMSVLIQ